MHNDLTPAERESALHRLLVFKNGFMAEAAAPVCADGDLPAERIEAAVELFVKAGTLIRKDLATGAVRYDWSEQYRGQGNDDRALQQRKAEWFAEYLQEVRPQLSGADQGIWLDQVQGDHEDIVASIEWALKEGANPQTAIDLCVASFRYWYVRCHLKQGSELTLEAVNRVPMRQDRNKLRALNNAAMMLEALGDHQRSANALRSGLNLARALGDRSAEAAILGNLATNARDLMDYELAKTYHEESIQIFRSVSDKTRLLPAVFNYAATKLDFNVTDGVARLLDEADQLAAESQEQWMMAFISDNRAHLAELQGEYEEARRHYLDSLNQYDRLKDAKGVARILKCLAELAVIRSLYDRAATLFGAAELARESCDVQVPPIESEKAIVAITSARGALGEDAFKKAYGIGHTMKLDEAVKYASAYS